MRYIELKNLCGLVGLLVLCIGCTKDANSGPKELFRDASSSSAPWITKGAMSGSDQMEATPVIWNGSLIYVISERDGFGTSGVAIQVLDAATSTLISRTLSPIGFISAVVSGNTLYVVGTTGWSQHSNSFYLISTTDLVSWTAPVKLFSAPSDTTFFNNSIAPDKNGGWVMAYENCQVDHVCFNVRFAHSDDLINWTQIGRVFGEGYYTACPTIRYVGGYYYVFFLNDFHGEFGTLVARSTDLTNWEISKQSVLTPFDGGDTSGNASDMDLVEINGVVQLIYCVSPQVPMITNYRGIRTAAYQGTMADFMAEFF